MIKKFCRERWELSINLLDIIKFITKILFVLYCNYIVSNKMISATDPKKNAFYILIMHQDIEMQYLESYEITLLEKISRNKAPEIIKTFLELYDKTKLYFLSMCVALYAHVEHEIKSKTIQDSFSLYFESITLTSIVDFAEKFNINLRLLEKSNQLRILMHFASIYIYTSLKLDTRNILRQKLELRSIEKKQRYIEEISRTNNESRNISCIDILQYRIIDYNIKLSKHMNSDIVRFMKEQSSTVGNQVYIFCFSSVKYNILLYFLVKNFELKHYDIKGALYQIMEADIPVSMDNIDTKTPVIYRNETDNDKNSVFKILVRALEFHYTYYLGSKAMSLIFVNIQLVILEVWDMLNLFLTEHLKYLSLNTFPRKFAEYKLQTMKSIDRLVLPCKTAEIQSEIESYQNGIWQKLAPFYKNMQGAIFVGDKLSSENHKSYKSLECYYSSKLKSSSININNISNNKILIIVYLSFIMSF